MRIPRALSFTGLKSWAASEEMFFLDRLAEARSPAGPQSRPAAGGSSFDLVVKRDLSIDLTGSCPPELFSAEVFERQVAEQHRSWALAAGEHALKAYKASGAYDDLLFLLRKSETPPRFEADVQGTIGGVPLFGRMDCAFQLAKRPIIKDWKLRGYFSTASPSRGYMLCRDGYILDGKPSRSHGKQHASFIPSDWNGLTIARGWLDDINQEFAAQLSIYSWLSGAEPGDEDFVVGIEELVCSQNGTGFPNIRVATHRGRISKKFQMQLLSRAQRCWEAITSGHVFQHLSRAQSDARCEMLEALARTRNQPLVEPGSQAEQLASLRDTYATMLAA